jgi:hypothetical protein
MNNDELFVLLVASQSCGCNRQPSTGLDWPFFRLILIMASPLIVGCLFITASVFVHRAERAEAAARRPIPQQVRPVQEVVRPVQEEPKPGEPGWVRPRNLPQPR